MTSIRGDRRYPLLKKGQDIDPRTYAKGLSDARIQSRMSGFDMID